ncbi:MAG: RelA/SpoT domain-containing protein [Acidobacteriaceae bacterium]|jgi:ppGpp synthetase/RelA/SpoT-type nucleotidyltranferase
MSVIDEFLEHYNREFDYYAQASSLVHQRLEGALAKQGIRAIVTSRAKGVKRLREKLQRRNAKKNYRDVKAIYVDIIDLAGVRVALYFPADKDRVDSLVKDTFVMARNEKRFPEKNAPKQGKHFMGYFATHYLVKLKATAPDSTEARYTDTKVEVQVASVLMHAWAEVEHDLEYKPETGTLSEDEIAILDELNGLVLTGELALERLQRAIQRRTAKQDVEFRDQFDLASFLSQRTKKQNWENASVGRVDVLMVALKHLRQATPNGIERYLVEVSNEDRGRPVADVIIDKILAKNQPGSSELPELVSSALASSTVFFDGSERSEEQAQIGRFLIEWRQVENLLRRSAIGRGLGTYSPLNMMNLLPSPSLRDSIYEIRRIRNSLVHGTEPVPSFVLDDATTYLRQRIIPELKKVVLSQKPSIHVERRVVKRERK